MLTKGKDARITLSIHLGDLSKIPPKDLALLIEFIEALGEDDLDDYR